jgi:hypothetical protein
MADRIRIIPHAPDGIPDRGSFEVWFADGRPSQYFHWDDNPGRASTHQEDEPGAGARGSQEACTGRVRERHKT